MNAKIGIIGKGFVGTAVAHGFSDQTGYSAQIKIYDTNPIRSSNSLDETVNDSEFIFLSVPTPASINGVIDLSIVDNVLKQINEINRSESNIVLLRSTVVPGTSEKIQSKYPNIELYLIQNF